MLTVEYIKENFGAFCQCFSGPRCVGRVSGEIEATDTTPKILVYVVSEFYNLQEGNLNTFKFDFVSNKEDLVDLQAAPEIDERASIWVFAEGRGFIGFCQYQEDDSIYQDELPWGHFSAVFENNGKSVKAEIYSHCPEPGLYELGEPMSSLCYIGLGSSRFGFGDLLFIDNRHERMVGTLPCSYHELSGFIHPNYDTIIKENKKQNIFIHFDEYIWPNTFFKNHEKIVARNQNNESVIKKIGDNLDQFYKKFIKEYLEHIDKGTDPTIMSKFIKDKQTELDNLIIKIEE